MTTLRESLIKFDESVVSPQSLDSIIAKMIELTEARKKSWNDEKLHEELITYRVAFASRVTDFLVQGK